MNSTYLEVTYRHGVPLAAYYYLPRQAGDISVCTRQADRGMVVDFNAAGTPIGIEITSPSRVSLASINAVLATLGQALAAPQDLAPLIAA